ncbi:MAG: segregation/condensation protein A [Candidatus Paceibacterota bacterium]|jgi:segregation and condensation protein A
MSDYQLRLEYYQGPLDKLLELIEEKKLEITTISLATVTGDFLNYLEQFKIAFSSGETIDETSPLFNAPPELLADFLVVASRLLLIKSKALLPSLVLSNEEETEIKDLEYRLKLYRELKKTQEHVRILWSEQPQIYTREFLVSTEPLFYPPSGITPEILFTSVLKIVGDLEQLFKPNAVVKNQIINLRQKIQEVITHLSSTPINFSELHAGKGKGELVVLFLAVLHLIKQQLVNVEQGGHFEKIMIAKNEPTEYNKSSV